jgi:hypothetical protein
MRPHRLVCSDPDLESICSCAGRHSEMSSVSMPQPSRSSSAFWYRSFLKVLSISLSILLSCLLWLVPIKPCNAQTSPLVPGSGKQLEEIMTQTGENIQYILDEQKQRVLQLDAATAIQKYSEQIPAGQKIRATVVYDVGTGKVVAVLRGNPKEAMRRVGLANSLRFATSYGQIIGSEKNTPDQPFQPKPNQKYISAPTKIQDLWLGPKPPEPGMRAAPEPRPDPVALRPNPKYEVSGGNKTATGTISQDPNAQSVTITPDWFKHYEKTNPLNEEGKERLLKIVEYSERKKLDPNLTHPSPVISTKIITPSPSKSPSMSLSEIERRENLLEEQRMVIERDRQALNRDCSKVPSSDTAKMEECQRRHDDIMRRMNKYKAELNYLHKLRASLGKKSPEADLKRLKQGEQE